MLKQTQKPFKVEWKLIGESSIRTSYHSTMELAEKHASKIRAYGPDRVEFAEAKENK